MNTSWMGSASNSPDGAGRFCPGEPISRLLDISPDRAELPLDKVWVLFGASLALRAEAEDGASRRFVGVLASDRSWHRLPVEVEVAGWSRGKSELILRPLADGRRPGWGRWYLRTGTAFVELLSAALQAPVYMRPAAQAAAAEAPSKVA